MRILLVTSWETACGIAEHSAMLKEAVEERAPTIEVLPDEDALDPASHAAVSIAHDSPMVHGIDLVHLNYQAALHSRWTPEVITNFRKVSGLPVVVTYHDSGVPSTEQCKAVCAAANASIVHEPCEDLPTAYYWRMGVPRAEPPLAFPTKSDRRILGLIGFPFPWKCFDATIEAANQAGWSVMLFAPGATPAQMDRWVNATSHIFVRTNFVERHEAIQWLSACDATAFMYVTHNAGQSGAINLGIAARKPVFALSTCRQFRALYSDPVARMAIRWVQTFEQLIDELRALPRRQGEVDEPTAFLAEQESWPRLAEKYIHLYRTLVAHE